MSSKKGGDLGSLETRVSGIREGKDLAVKTKTKRKQGGKRI
jgi:hypothetical protein